MSMTRQRERPHPDNPQFIPYRCDDCGFTVHHPVYVRYQPRCPECNPGFDVEPRTAAGSLD